MLLYLLFVCSQINKSELRNFVEEAREYNTTKKDLLFVCDIVRNFDRTKSFINVYNHKSNPGVICWLIDELYNFLFSRVYDFCTTPSVLTGTIVATSCVGLGVYGICSFIGFYNLFQGAALGWGVYRISNIYFN